MTTLPVLNSAASGSARFEHAVRQAGREGPSALNIDTVQANIGLACNLACRHCHVESSPARTEAMDWPTMELVLTAAGKAGAGLLDITGGSPEMHRHFRRFVQAAVAQGLAVMVRTNLTIMLEAGYQDMPRFLADNKAHLVASMPCYLEQNVDRQRGPYVYRDSVRVIQMLNDLGYGARPELPLDLVYNPGGPSLPPPQKQLEADYRRELRERFGIRFTKLYTITNMAIGRFLQDLQRQGRADQYLQVLRDAFNPATLDGLMCRRQLHVAPDGTMYDCDFNFALGLPAAGPQTHVRHFDADSFLRRRIFTGEHCFGCTAGHGSSCRGAMA